MSTINVIRGDSKSLLVRVKNADGTATDLDGYTFRLTIALDGTVVYEAIGQILDDGVHFNLPPSFTETLEILRYDYDIEMADATRTMVHTIVIGNVSVRADVGGPPA